MQLSKGNQKETVKSVFFQLPFFCCPDFLLDTEMQKDISKYVYCEDTKTPAYPGDYNQIPSKWKEKHFIIKQAISILHDMKRDEIRKK